MLKINQIAFKIAVVLLACFLTASNNMAGSGNTGEPRAEVLVIGPIKLGECLERSWHGQNLLAQACRATGMTREDVLAVFNKTKVLVMDKVAPEKNGQYSFASDSPSPVVEGPCSFVFHDKGGKELLIHIDSIMFSGLDLSRPPRSAKLFLQFRSPGFPWTNETRGYSGSWYASNMFGGRLSWEASGQFKHTTCP